MEKGDFMNLKSIQNQIETPKVALCKDDYDELSLIKFVDWQMLPLFPF